MQDTSGLSSEPTIDRRPATGVPAQQPGFRPAATWRIRRALVLALGLVIPLVIPLPVPAAPATDRIASTCRLVESAAAANRLPVEFLTRLLWTESRFRSEVTSPAGAEGVAQFMPQTAAERGLADPRDPAQAIAHAARLLVDLNRQFGNLGLAAAAYNAGAARIANWLRRGGGLPAETRLYVEAVTGYRVEAWVGAGNFPMSQVEAGSCDALVATLVHRDRQAPPAPPAILQTRLDGGLSRAIALLASVPTATRGRPIPPANRRGAEALCAEARALGMPCAVYGQ